MSTWSQYQMQRHRRGRARELSIAAVNHYKCEECGFVLRTDEEIRMGLCAKCLTEYLSKKEQTE